MKTPKRDRQKTSVHFPKGGERMTTEQYIAAYFDRSKTRFVPCTYIIGDRRGTA